MTLDNLVIEYEQKRNDAQSLSAKFQGLVAFLKERTQHLSFQSELKSYLENSEEISSLIKFLGLSPDYKQKLIGPLSHRSFCHENTVVTKHSYERFEFLGDTVLGLVVSTRLFSEFGELSEGELSRLRGSLVNEDTLSKLADSFSLSRFILVGKGEFKSKGHEANPVKADVLEALLGVVYLSDGLEKAQEVFERIVVQYEKSTGDKFFSKDRLQNFDAKSRLQELTMKLYKSTPVYKETQKECGGFIIELYIENKMVVKVEAPSKKQGQREAARICLNDELYITKK
ncbi:ribonuclease III domain protein [Bacteriovorax sp. BSW11_IV]|uniref:ribonuclease III family protein n=1 Tax=Bacteriovorax sp. BSW11_IV TaxID=1353529 RepID=UPI00038A342C|nr:ribonuclease III domain-containing protein [Bacteriovorax sp. BSW11_IV]EQC48990.1 ribonuclease III domain protein [Bacteriovorax sp. BSW11_IV]